MDSDSQDMAKTIDPAGTESGWIQTRSWLGLFALTGLIFALYWPVLGFEFVNWDDPWYVLRNPLITSWHPENLWRIFTEMSVKNYAPLTTLSLLIDHTLFGLDPGGYHLTNVVLHVVNSILVYFLVTRLASSHAVGLVTAALFAVHPIQIENIAWVSSRKTLLCSGFMLASGLCWLREDRSAKQELWGTAWLTLALLSKAAAIIVPPIVLAYDLMIRRKTMAESLPRQIVPGFLCLLLLNVTMAAQTTEMGGVRGHLELGKLHILAVDAVILWQYVGMLIWPSDLCVLYDPPTRGIALPVACAVVAWLAVAAGCWTARNRAPMFAWCVFTWFCLLFPVLNLFPITTLMNDRYLYLPCLCLFGLAAGGVGHIGRQFGRQMLIQSGSFAVVVLCVSAFSARSIAHLPVWRDDFSLWRHTIDRVPQLPVVQIQWADALHHQGETDRAIAVLSGTMESGLPDEPDRERIRRRLSEWR